MGTLIRGAVTGVVLAGAAFIVARGYQYKTMQNVGRYNQPGRKLFISDEDALRSIISPQREV